MTGIQKSTYEALRELSVAVEGGKYGKDDGFDAEAFHEDLQDVMFAAE